MIMTSTCGNHTPVFRDQAASTSQARRPFRLAILSLRRTGCVCAIVVTLFVLSLNPAPPDVPVAYNDPSLGWHPGVAFFSDNRPVVLATSGIRLVRSSLGDG